MSTCTILYKNNKTNKNFKRTHSVCHHQPIRSIDPQSQLSVTMAALEVGWVHPLTRAHFANFDLSFNQFYQVLNKRRSDYRQEVSTDNNWSIIAVLIIMISELQNKITESKYKQKKAFLCWSDENSFILIVTVSDVVTMETSEWRQ